jgi:hypothetical protein
MNALTEYFAAKHNALELKYGDNCLTTAREIAKLLLDQGKQPYIMKLEIVEQRGENRFHGPLMPLRYRGTVTFTQHYVCCCDDLAFDPIHSQPVNISDYSVAIFGLHILMQNFVSSAEMINHLAGLGNRAKDTDATDRADLRGSDPS